jgi:hypothetical protein
MKEKITMLAPLLFLVALKLVGNGQFWYFVTYPIFLLPIKEEKLRTFLMMTFPLLDVYSFMQLIHGPFGYLVGNCYQGLTVFTRLTLH